MSELEQVRSEIIEKARTPLTPGELSLIFWEYGPEIPEGFRTSGFAENMALEVKFLQIAEGQ